MADLTPKEAREVCEEEGVANGQPAAYGSGVFDGLTKGNGMSQDTFLAIHGTAQRLRHLVREAMRAGGHKIASDPGAMPTNM